MEKTSIKERALKNISYSMISFMWPVLIALVVTPIIVRYFGIKEYGIYIFINTLVSLAGLLDIGFASAVSKFMSERHSGNDKEGLRNLFITSNTIFFVIGIIGACFIMSSVFVGLAIFPGQVTSSYEIYIPAFIYAGILFFINSINSLHVIIPTAYQRFDVGSKIGLPFITIQQVGILLVVFFGWSINTLFLFQTLLMLFFYFVYKKYTMIVVGEDEKKFLSVYGWSKEEAFSCYTFGIVSFINNLAGVSLTYLDRMIIPIFLGPSNLTYYSLPGSITNKIPSFSATLSSIVFPMTAHFEGGGNRDMTRNLYLRSMRLIIVISTAVSVTFIVFAYQILQFWINKDLADKATKVLIILAVTNLVLAVIGLLNNVLLAMSKLRSLITTSIVTALINAVLLILLLPRFGIEGAAYAYLFALSPYVFLIYVTEKKYLNLSLRKKHYIKLFYHLFFTSLVTVVVDYFFIRQFITNFFSVIIALVFSFSFFIGIYYYFGFFEKEDTGDILSFLKNNRFLKFKNKDY
jgi:O-antigen/teichoic acid export membrane protein